MEENHKVIDVLAFSGPSRGGAADEIDLLEYWKVIWRGKWFIAGFTLACTLLAVFVSFHLLAVTYKSEAVLIPLEAEGRSLGNLAGLVGSLPLPITLPGGGGKAESIAAFLNSRILKERLITKYDLLALLYADLWDAEKKEWLVDDRKRRPTVIKGIQEEILDDIFRVTEDAKSKLISLSWEDRDPAFAALMLERVIKELQFYFDHEYDTDAKRERQFVEQQLAKATQELTYWEQQVPNKDLNLATIQRERLATRTVYAELRKQLEVAKISEAKEMVPYKVLDPPFIPENEYRPRRILICASTMVASGFLAIFLIIGHGAVQAARMKTLKEYTK